MTDDEHINGLNLTAQDIARMTEEAYQDVTRRIREGEAPREAISAVMAQWQGAYLTVLGAALSERLRQSIGTTELKRYPLGPVSLSDRLYQNAREVSAITAEIIRQHNQGWQSARQLALQLYEGYNFKDDPLKVTARLPKYLRELMQAPLVGTELKRLLARIQINTLKTPYLKAAYLQALDGLEQGIGQERLSNLLRTAFYERNRYFANRIAQTELHRAQADQRAREIMAEDGIRFVQVKLSSTHPVTDICDLHAKLDKYGVGAGVYPKELAPKPPFHPHCRCLLRPRVDIDTDTRFRERANAERNFLNALPNDEARKIAGSWDKLQRVRKGESLETILNEGKDALYHLSRLGDIIENMKSEEIALRTGSLFVPSLTYNEELARDFVVSNGKLTNTEYGAAISSQWDGIKTFGGEYKDTLIVPVFGAPSASVSVHHNHSLGDSFSKADFRILMARDEIGAIAAHGHNGFYAAAMRRVDSMDEREVMSIIFTADQEAISILRRALSKNLISHHDADAGLRFVVMALILEDKGYIDYACNSSAVIEMAKKVINL